MWQYLQIFFWQKKSYIQTRGGTPPPLFVIKTHNIVFDPLKQQQESIKNIVHIIGASVLGRDSERVKSWSGQIWRGWQRARWKSEWGAEWSGGEVKKDWSDNDADDDNDDDDDVGGGDGFDGGDNDG